jgi:pyruvate formate lyase activating enzyme
MSQAPLILDIKGNSLDDGPGIRTVVFFKGCPLSCVWCHNPECKKVTQELAFEKKECVECDTCRKVCPKNALDPNNPFYINRDKCDLCFQCVDACPSGALTKVGKNMTVAEIVAVIKKDIPFYLNSGGGVTLSGGEPTLFIEFTSELLQELKKLGLHTILETCGHFQLPLFDKCIYHFLDSIYFDLKIIDPGEHKQFCGISNDRILENFRVLYQWSLNKGVPVLPRIPLIPGITATKNNLEKIAAFLRANQVDRVAILEYNPLWHSKAEKIGVKSLVERKTWMSRTEIQECRDRFKDFHVI